MTTKQVYDYIVQYLNIHDDSGDGFSLEIGQIFIDIMRNSDGFDQYLQVYTQKKNSDFYSIFHIYDEDTIWIQTVLGVFKLHDDCLETVLNNIYVLLKQKREPCEYI